MNGDLLFHFLPIGRQRCSRAKERFDYGLICSIVDFARISLGRNTSKDYLHSLAGAEFKFSTSRQISVQVSIIIFLLEEDAFRHFSVLEH